MTTRIATACTSALLLVSCHQQGVTSAAQSRPSGMVPIVISTERGDISVSLDSAHAPVTVTNFLRYVDRGAFTDGRFHRTVTRENQPRDTVRIEVIQGSARTTRPDSSFPAVVLERTSVTGLRHLDGTISMARGGPNSATSSFFITIGTQPSLDEGGHRNLDGQGFAAFGRVTAGMELVRAIQQSPHTEQNLTPPIAIRSVRRLYPKRTADPAQRALPSRPFRASCRWPQTSTDTRKFVSPASPR
ncbi:MAG: peptidylprolyl isomerase [Gemmatimonadaceae bacterium]|nr:peptidylprolyl isomerase [Gemmatimonadaceae bacterium]